MHGYWAQFAKVAVAHILAVASPGPDFAMVVRQSIAHGRRVAVWTAIGVGSAILVHVTYALLGIGILLRTYPYAFAAVKYSGAAYLAWIGIKALRSRPRSEMPVPSSRASADIANPAIPGTGAAWVSGFLTNIFNPKATLFFVAIFASLIDPAT
ncbi:MAG TPA: LysE family translocator, partial [Opitutaceae bacterium]